MKLFIPIIILLLAFCLFVSTPKYVSNKCQILPLPEEEIKLGLPWKKIPCNYEGFMWGPSIVEQINTWIMQNQSTNEKFYTIQSEK